MTRTGKAICLFTLCFLIPVFGTAQDKHYYQTDFTTEEFAGRRAKIFDAIGKNSIALIQGAKGVADFNVFRQTNNFYYLTGLETPHAYLLLDGRNQKTTLYLPHRDAGRERNQGKILSAEDADLVTQLTGIDQVRGVEFLSLDLVGTGLIRPPAPLLYTPLSPAETGTDSRDELLNGQARVSSDPWDGLPSRESRFRELINSRFPQFEIEIFRRSLIRSE